MNVTSEHNIPVEECVQKLVGEAEEFARRDPSKAVGIAFGVGLALNVVPKRFLVGTVALAAVTLARPVLLGLGVMKAFEICCSGKSGTASSSQSNIPQTPIL